MSLSALGEKLFMPNDDMVAMVLGSSFKFWDEIRKHLISAYEKIGYEWKFYGKEAGWTQNIKSGKRVLFNFIPLTGYFQINFTLGEKAVAAAYNSDLPKEIATLMSNAKKCVCGYSLRLDVKTKADVQAVIKLIKIKNEN